MNSGVRRFTWANGQEKRLTLLEGCIYNQLVIYSTVSATTAAAPFNALSDPARRQILELLRESERSVNELVQRLDLSQPGVSKHLRVLREAGLVRVRPDGRRRWYGLRAEPLAELDEWLAPYREYWGGRLDALEQHLDRQEDR
jgi:DNA-binding transcriptional ArsR family regulator